MNNPYENTWVNTEIITTHVGEDNLSGIAYWQYSENGGTYLTESNTDSNTYNANWGAERNSTVRIRACDYAGNCSEPQETTIKIDKTAPMISNVVLGECSNGKRPITVSASDASSGMTGYAITDSSTVPSSFVSSTSSSWTSDSYSPGIYYAWVKDEAGNISSSTTVNVGACDTTGPTIVFGTNGSSGWVSQATTAVTVTDDSGVKSISYGWSTSSTSTSTSFTTSSGTLLSDKCGRESGNDGECYLYVYACDNSNNCSSNRTNAFYVDVTGPTITNVTNATCSDGLTASYSAQDTSSGLAERWHIWCDKRLGAEDCYSYLPFGEKLSTPITTKKTYKPKWISTHNPPPDSGTRYSFWVKAIDAVGNYSLQDTSNTSGNLKPYQGTGAC